MLVSPVVARGFEPAAVVTVKSLIDGSSCHAHHLGYGIAGEVFPSVKHHDLAILGIEPVHHRDHLTIARALNDEDGGVCWWCDSQAVELLFQARSPVQRPQLIGEHPAGYPIEMRKGLRRRRDVISTPPGNQERLRASVACIRCSRSPHATGQYGKAMFFIEGLKERPRWNVAHHRFMSTSLRSLTDSCRTFLSVLWLSRTCGGKPEHRFGDSEGRCGVGCARPHIVFTAGSSPCTGYHLLAHGAPN